MKKFILAINKYKKWIVLGLSILMLFLFLFPFRNYSYKTDTAKIPYLGALIISVANFIRGEYFEAYPIDLANKIDSLKPQILTLSIFNILLCLGSIVIIVVTIYLTQKDRNFLLLFSLCVCVITKIVNYLTIEVNAGPNYSIAINISPELYILIGLLILDIVYLVLERKYLKEVKQEPEEVVKTF